LRRAKACRLGLDRAIQLDGCRFLRKPHARCGKKAKINEGVLNDVLSRFSKARPIWEEWLEKSFLSPEAKQKFSAILTERRERMCL